MTAIHISEFDVGLNGQCVEVVKSLQPGERAEEGMVLGLNGPELPVRYDFFPHIGSVQLIENLRKIS